MLRNEASRIPVTGERSAEILHSVQDDTGALMMWRAKQEELEGSDD
jgi:hypothetical protein